MTREIFFLVIALCCGSAMAEPDAGDTVFWYEGNFPPVTFLSGTHRGEGWGDKGRDLLIRRMPEFRHEVVEATPSRSYDALRNRPNTCNAETLKTPARATLYEYSEPLLRIMPNGIITTRSRLHLFEPFINKHGELDLDHFLALGKYRIGIVQGRSFGPGIDAVLTKHADKHLTVSVLSSDHFKARLLKLVNQREFDAIFGYAMEMVFVSRELELAQGEVVFLSVAQETDLVPIYVACSKTEFGKRVIAAVNRELAAPGARAELEEVAAAYRLWQDKDTSARFDRMRKAFAERGKARPL